MKLINLLEEGRQLNPILLNLIIEILDEYFFRLLAVNALNYKIKCMPWTLRIRDSDCTFGFLQGLRKTANETMWLHCN